MSRELIRVEGVDRSFGPVTVLQDINIMVNEGDRIGIVGHNGAGKTTLLNTISEQKQDVGDIEFASGIRIAYLTQIRDIDEDSTIEEELSRKGRQFQELEEEIAGIEAQMADPAFYEGDWETVMERYSELQQTLGASGGGNVANIAKAQVLNFNNNGNGFSSTSADIGIDALTLEFGTWSGTSFSTNSNYSSTTLSLTSGATSLSDVRDAINKSCCC